MTTNQEKSNYELLTTFIVFRREGRNVPEHEIIQDLARLHRYEQQLRKINENEANGWPRPVVETRDGKRYTYAATDAAWQARDQKREARIQEEVKALIAKYGFGVRFDGDPRGGAIKLLIGNEKNGMGDGWGIYW